MTSSSLEILLQQTRELVNLSTQERSSLIDTLRSAFIAERLSTNIHLESVRKKAVKLLEDKIDTLSPHQLIRAIQALNEVAESDFSSLVEDPKDKSRVSIQNVVTSFSGNNMNIDKIRNLGEVIEAVEIMKSDVQKLISTDYDEGVDR